MKQRKMINFVARFAFSFYFILSLFPKNAQAAHASSETSVSSLTLIESVSADGEFTEEKRKNKDGDWSWDANYTYTKSIDTSQGDSITDITHETSGNVLWDGQSGYASSLGLVWSATPEEHLQTTGFNASFAYTHHYKQPAKSTDDENDDEEGSSEFSPKIRYKMSLGKRGYTQTFPNSTTKVGRRSVKSPSGSNIIEQSFAGISLMLKPRKGWRWSAGYTYYFYNRNVADFTALLDSKRAIARGFSSLSNTTSGLNFWAANLGLTVDLTEKWNLDLTESYGIAAADLTSSTATKAVVEREFGDDFAASFGAEYQSSAVLNETLAFLGLNLDF
jgi:hypothetical protein